MHFRCMATETEHRTKANKNQQFLATIDRGMFPEWTATVAFYTALHFVEILAARVGMHNGGHRSRNQ